jgi:hypothetical protein
LPTAPSPTTTHLEWKCKRSDSLHVESVGKIGLLDGCDDHGGLLRLLFGAGKQVDNVCEGLFRSVIGSSLGWLAVSVEKATSLEDDGTH